MYLVLMGKSYGYFNHQFKLKWIQFITKNYLTTPFF